MVLFAFVISLQKLLAHFLHIRNSGEIHRKKTLPRYRSELGFKGTVVNIEHCHRCSLEITTAVPFIQYISSVSAGQCTKQGYSMLCWDRTISEDCTLRQKGWFTVKNYSPDIGCTDSVRLWILNFIFLKNWERVTKNSCKSNTVNSYISTKLCFTKN